ncbi:hypothetical protein OIN60_08825 [Paenibacillus sp. P96]|uniref:Phage holin n=1 Tax=Paenibacillus zeirhizosphaerae TaxID=2987519 RepID=A0ABT9FQ72_9BACL|nr:hypothetical protein [Paenibacillus sp. P96]MDP4096874.1 hypothetical protein [Paenibacillus sp. P96]
MNKIDWKAKLSSRKFWALLAGLVTAVMTAAGASENTIAQTAAVIGAFALIAVYILAEAYVDGKAAGSSSTDKAE